VGCLAAHWSDFIPCPKCGWVFLFKDERGLSRNEGSTMIREREDMENERQLLLRVGAQNLLDYGPSGGAIRTLC
jgi:hypothetical protein